MWEDLNMTNKRRMGSNRATSVSSNTRLLIPNLSVHLLCADARLLPDSMATKRWVRQWLRPRQKKRQHRRPKATAMSRFGVKYDAFSLAPHSQRCGHKHTCPIYIQGGTSGKRIALLTWIWELPGLLLPPAHQDGGISQHNM